MLNVALLCGQGSSGPEHTVDTPPRSSVSPGGPCSPASHRARRTWIHVSLLGNLRLVVRMRILSSTPHLLLDFVSLGPTIAWMTFSCFGVTRRCRSQRQKGSPHRHVSGFLCRRRTRKRDIARNVRFTIRDSAHGQSSGCLLFLSVIQAIVRLGSVTASFCLSHAIVRRWRAAALAGQGDGEFCFFLVVRWLAKPRTFVEITHGMT